MSAITIPPRYSNIFDGTREEYSRLAYKFLANKDNFKKGKQSLEGFTKLYGYLKEGDVIRGVQLSKGNIKFPDKIKDLKSKKKSTEKRESNLKGLTPEIRNQIEFLNDVTEVEAKYEAMNGNPESGKLRDRDMKALWRKYRRKDNYNPTKTYGWPEGKTEKGYLAWQKKVFNDLKGGEGVDVDHGKTAAFGGTNSRTNLSLQESNWNRWIKGNKKVMIRTDEQYDEAGIAFDKNRSFQEYLAFEDDPNIKLVTDLGLEGMTDIHKRVGVDVNAVIAQNEQRLQQEAYQEQIEASYQRSFADSRRLHAKENGVIDNAQGAALWLTKTAVNSTVEASTGVPNVTDIFAGSKKLLDKDPTGLIDIVPNLRQTSTTPYRALNAS